MVSRRRACGYNRCRTGNLQTKRRLSPTPSGTVSYTHGNAKRQRLLSPKQYEIVGVLTSRGMNRAMLFSEAILLAEWEANAPLREAMAIKRERWRVKRAQERRGAKRAAKQRST